MMSTAPCTVETSPDLRRLLAETLFMACATHRIGKARQILEGYSVLSPASREVAIGGGLIELTSGNAVASIIRLQPLAAARDPYAVAFLALALKITGRTAESEAVLATMPASNPLTDDQSAQALAKSLREEQ